MSVKGYLWERVRIIQHISEAPLELINIQLPRFIVATLTDKEGSIVQRRMLFLEHLQDVYFLRVHPERKNELSYKSRSRNEWRFAKVNLTEEQRAEYLLFAANEGFDPYEQLGLLIAEGYKFSATFDGDNDAWIATLSGRKFEGPNQETSLSARHGSLYDAVSLVLFKHLVVCKGGTWTDQISESNWG